MTPSGARRGRAFRLRVVYIRYLRTFFSRSQEPLPCQRYCSRVFCSRLPCPPRPRSRRTAGPAPLQLTKEQDHKLMMEALGIKSLRQGANGRNPNAPHAANYDESKANPYPNLPDPLTLKNGEKVTTPEQWWNAAPAGDRRGLRPRSLRPRPERRSQGEVGGHRARRRRRSATFQPSPSGSWATSTIRGARRSRSTSSSR